MRTTPIILAIALALLSISTASAYPYVTAYSPTYVTSYGGYGPATGYAYHQWTPGNDYYRLTSPSPSSYPYTYRYASNRLFMGHYSRFDGSYHESWTNRPVVPVQYYGYGHSNAIPVYKYYNPYTVHYE